MNQLYFDNRDEITIRLLHYFITEQNYNPIILHGAKDEIWLENLNSDYKIIRINSHYIHNNEQLEVDIRKTKHIMKNIKRKLFSFNMKAINILVNYGDNVKITPETNYSDITCIGIKDIVDIGKQELLLETFPTIKETKNYKEKGIELFMKLTNDINKQNEIHSNQAEDIFKPKLPIITYALIGINALMFVITLLLGGLTNLHILMDLGAIEKNSVLNGDYYRLITSAFLHGGIIHFLFNNYALYIIGPQLESFFGKAKFIAIYLGSAIIGNLLSLVFTTPNIVGVGASGAIFGLLGSLLYFGYHHRVYLGTVIRSQIIPLIIINLIIGFSLPGIDNAAHIGGLIGGVLITMAIGVKYKTTKTEQTNGIIMLLIFVAFLSYLIFFN